MKRPKAPKPTAQELAVVERQSRMLDEEMEESEKRLKALARGKLGSKSLLAKGASASGQSSASRGYSFSGNVGGSKGAGSAGLSSGSGYTATNPTISKKAEK